MDSLRSSSTARSSARRSARPFTASITAARTTATRWPSTSSRRSTCSGSPAPAASAAALYGFEHYVERTQPEGVRSGPGDLDLVAYSLRKYVRLALKGHPTILLLLFVPDELTLVETELGRGAARAAAGAPLTAGRPRLPRLPARPEGAPARDARAEAGQPARARRGARLRHEVRDARRPARLPGRSSSSRPGGVTLPMPEPERSRVMAIRTGERTFDETIAEIDEVEQRLARRWSGLAPAEPDRAAVDASSSGPTAGPGAGGVQRRDEKRQPTSSLTPERRAASSRG